MSRKLLVGSLAAGAAVIALAFNFESKPVYSYRVADFLARNLRDREVRVEGLLVRGSLCKVTEDCGYRFSITDSFYEADNPGTPSPRSRPTLAVSYDGCLIPDTFRDVPSYDLIATVQGERCRTCHEFKATQLMAKCPGKYEMSSDGGVQVAAPPPPLCSALKPSM